MRHIARALSEEALASTPAANVQRNFSTVAEQFEAEVAG